MDKNSLILEIKNDINSIKKQLDVTFAKIDVLEALIKLEKASKLETVEELGVEKEPKSEPVEELGVVDNKELPRRGSSLDRQVSEEQSDGDACVGVKEEPGSEIEPIVEPTVEPELEPIVEPEIESEPELVVELGVCSEELGGKDKEVPLRNLMSIIGLNDRFRFRHDLFSDDNDLFKETIETLNTIEKFADAVEYLQAKFSWKEDDATVVYFYEIIKPKF